MSKTRAYYWLTETVKNATAKRAAVEVANGELPRLFGAESAVVEKALRQYLGIPQDEEGAR